MNKKVDSAQEETEMDRLMHEIAIACLVSILHKTGQDKLVISYADLQHYSEMADNNLYFKGDPDQQTMMLYLKDQNNHGEENDH